MRYSRFLLICFAVAHMGACGSPDAGPDLAPVTGKITWNGQPLQHSSVTFIPLEDTAGWGGQAKTNELGEYKMIEGKTGRSGVLAGSYRVVISRRLMPDGSPVPPDDRTPPIESPARESLPAEYSDRLQSKLRVTIPSEGRTFDLSLPK